LEARREMFVNRGRRALLVKLLAEGLATADHVRRAVTLPKGIDPRCLGTVPGPLARAGIIRRAGFIPSDRAERHASIQSVWELADETAARRWLATHPDFPDLDENAGAVTPLFPDTPNKSGSAVALPSLF
jgi:hypothetical protein